MHCGAGNEEQIAEVLKVRFQDRGEVILFTYEKMRRYEGEWHIETDYLFPGYVFFLGRDELGFTEEEERYFLPVGKSEEQQLTELVTEFGKSKYHLPMSKGYISGGVTFVTEGPLKGREKAIAKIDRHRRLARINSPLEKYRAKGVWTGLEIVSKN